MASAQAWAETINPDRTPCSKRIKNIKKEFSCQKLLFIDLVDESYKIEYLFFIFQEYYKIDFEWLALYEIIYFSNNLERDLQYLCHLLIIGQYAIIKIQKSR